MKSSSINTFNSEESGERSTPSKKQHPIQANLPTPPLADVPQKTVLQGRCHGLTIPQRPETSEFCGPLTSHVGELRPAAGASALAGNPHYSHSPCGVRRQAAF